MDPDKNLQLEPSEEELIVVIINAKHKIGYASKNSPFDDPARKDAALAGTVANEYIETLSQRRDFQRILQLSDPKSPESVKLIDFARKLYQESFPSMLSSAMTYYAKEYVKEARKVFGDSRRS